MTSRDMRVARDSGRVSTPSSRDCAHVSLLMAALALASCGGLSSHRSGGTEATGGTMGTAGTGTAGTGTAGTGTAGTGTAGVKGFAPGKPTEVTASVPAAYANFGTTVALSGDTLAVGAPGPVGEAGGDEPSGSTVPVPAVFIYRLNGEDWAEEAVLTGTNLPAPDPSDAAFATTLALEGDTLVVGAPRQIPPGAPDGSLGAGSVYVFERSGRAWRLATVLAPATYHANQQFGAALALSQGVLAVADPSDDGYSGSVALFERVNGSWVETTVIRAGSPVPGSTFGSGVALDRGTLAVAAPGAAVVHVIEPSPAEWLVGATEATAQGSFGNRLVLDGDTLVVASYTESSNAPGVNGVPGAPYPSDGYFCVNSGAAYVYRRGENGWAPEAFLKSADPQAQGLFGWDLALHGDTLLVAERLSDAAGAGYVEPGEPTGGAETRGAVWVFQRAGTSWSLEGALKSPNGETAFASSVGALAISERFVAVGAFADLTTPVDPSVLATPYGGGVFVWPW